MKIPVLGYDECYTVDDLGNFYRNDIKLSTYKIKNGYIKIRLRKNKKRYNKFVHRLIWESFNGKIPEKYEINHIDHNKSNNRLDNLELVTHSENLQKAIKYHGHFGFIK